MKTLNKELSIGRGGENNTESDKNWEKLIQHLLRWRIIQIKKIAFQRILLGNFPPQLISFFYAFVVKPNAPNFIILPFQCCQPIMTFISYLFNIYTEMYVICIETLLHKHRKAKVHAEENKHLIEANTQHWKNFKKEEEGKEQVQKKTHFQLWSHQLCIALTLFSEKVELCLLI